MEIGDKVNQFEIATGIESAVAACKTAQQGFANGVPDISAMTASVNALIAPMVAAAGTGMLTPQMVGGLANLQGFLANPMLKDLIVNAIKNFSSFITDPAIVAAAQKALPQLANLFVAKPVHQYRHSGKGGNGKNASMKNMIAKYGQDILEDEMKADSKDWTEQEFDQWYGADEPVAQPKGIPAPPAVGPASAPAAKPVVKPKVAPKPTAKPVAPPINVMNDPASQEWLKDVGGRPGPTAAKINTLTKKYGR